MYGWNFHTRLGGNKMETKAKVTKTQVWPNVNKGTHLTVYTYEDGSTKLEWDDDALLKEVQNAILKAESTIPAKTKRTKKAKE